MAKKATLPRTHQKTQKKTQHEKIAATIAAIDQIKPPTEQAASAITLLKSWLADESGYDEEIWPKLKKALDRERDRVRARTHFDG